MSEPIYVPILKGKEGEYAALEALKMETKGQIMPLIEIPAIPYDYVNECPSKSLDEYVVGIPDRLYRACATTPFYLDLPWFGQEETLGSGRTAFESVLTQSTELGVTAVPVVYRESSPAYLAAAKAHAAATQSGTCIRLLVEDFEEDVHLDAEIDRLLSTATGGIQSADLMLDLEDLGANAGRAALIARSVFTMIPRKDAWRRIILGLRGKSSERITLALNLVTVNTAVYNSEINTRNVLTHAKLFDDQSVRFSSMTTIHLSAQDSADVDVFHHVNPTRNLFLPEV